MKLTELRNTLKMSQKETALFLGIPLRTYKRYETNNDYQKTYKYTLMCNTLSARLETQMSSEPLFRHKPYNIVVAGCGYVGLSLACILSKKNNVKMTDINEAKIALINDNKSPFYDPIIAKYLQNGQKIVAELSDSISYQKADFIVIATPTNFDVESNCFDTSSIENVIKLTRLVNKTATIVIKSTIPLGYTELIKKKNADDKIIFSPEFLREGNALFDNLNPARIIVGCDEKTRTEAKIFSLLLKEAADKANVPVLLMKNEEAEAVKLFSNAYLAMRVAYFNELDSYAEANDFRSQNIIKGIALDPRIGNFYNNPSFGYGGYCLPKDTIQLARSFLNIPNSNLIKAIVRSNATRKQFVTNQIIKKALDVTHKKKDEIIIGVYLITMKSNSDNYRSSSTIDIVNMLNKQGIKTIIFDPHYQEGEQDFSSFVTKCDFYIANRYDEKLKKLKNVLYTRDLFNRD